MDTYGLKNAAPVATKQGSRIEADTERVTQMVVRVETITKRILRHAQNLGYYFPEPSGASELQAVDTTLADALAHLDKAVGNCSGSLNVFD